MSVSALCSLFLLVLPLPLPVPAPVSVVVPVSLLALVDRQFMLLHLPHLRQSLVIGCISFREDGDFIDCRKMGLGGKSIPGLVDKITEIQGTAKFVLLVRC